MKYKALVFWIIRKKSHNLSNAAVLIGALTFKVLQYAVCTNYRILIQSPSFMDVAFTAGSRIYPSLSTFLLS